MDILTIEYTAAEDYVKPDLIGGLAWIAALESGEYKQATGCLKHSDSFGSSYCCLGVKCEIDGLIKPKPSVRNVGSVSEVATYEDHSSGSYLPYSHPWAVEFGYQMVFPSGFRAIVAYKRLDSITKKEAVNESDCYSLADMNDKGFRFPTIVMLIKAAWNPI